ncbi:hypothetical protein PF005_g30680 [Phytophthora fragariae]|uniref:Uncharacterized protein n=1 Tax=Phytophthora fragariae TaxID=53985 RepID=A0A6A3VGR4_9STRA|nr:hypothetical protein PF003_g30369 [Phytophthora fragariae]KAE9060153.1 hypothetical protein PF010_g30328 [Phytophthora fragariae]KAE9162864.1 hypothetical protein PF005_g30680 [Phytophthora fragariae]KAE9167090.1 hypothetical protein PF002_g30967 [Phytophthora fragariae]
MDTNEKYTVDVWREMMLLGSSTTLFFDNAENYGATK